MTQTNQNLRMPDEEDRFFWSDHLRAIASIAVIILHISGSILYQYGKISDFDWWVGNIFDSTVRFCVPIFLMLTGALMFSKTYTLGSFFQKRISKILYPFLFWSSIYVAFDLFLRSRNGLEIDVFGFIYTQFKNGASYHLWYIYMLLGIYLIFPVMNKWVIHSTKKEISYYMLVWLVVMLFSLPLIEGFIPKVNLIYFSGYLGYPIVGYLLSIMVVNNKTKYLSWALFISGVFITIVGTFFLTKKYGYFYEGLYSYLTPNVFLASTGIFLLFRCIDVKNEFYRRIISLISKYSYGIYLAHAIVLVFLMKAGISWNFINPIIGIPIMGLMGLIISLGITYLISKIPYGKYISG